MYDADYIRNPLTGNWILVDGPTYTRLLRTGQISLSKLSRLLVTTRPVPKAREYPQLSNRETKRHLQEISQLPLNPESHSKTGQGGKTKGWSEVKPSRGRERSELYQECGRRCFFKPNKASPGKSGYPICPRISERKPLQCQLDCRGIQSARQYAARFDPEMAKQIHQIQKNTKCR